MKTTIQISNELRNKLKIASAYYNETYENLLKEILELFEKEVSFKTKDEFCNWFESNYRLLGIKKILVKQRKSCPDYVVQDVEGRKLHVDVELFAKRFLTTPHTSGVDYIISAYSSDERIANVPVIALNMLKAKAMLEDRTVSKIATELLRKRK